MADKYEEKIQRFLDQQKITEEEAAKASSFSDVVERITNGTIRSANPKYDLAGTNTPKRGKDTYISKYSYISNDSARDIVNGRRASTSHGIWKQVNSPSWMNNRVQHTIEQLTGITDGDVLLGLDVESVGTPSFQEGATGHFGVTQIAAVPYRVDFHNADGPLVRLPGEPVNVLTRPNDATMSWLAQAIDKLDEPGVVPKLSAEEYRSLKDLIAYAGDARFGDAAGVILKTNSKAIPDGANLKNYKDQIREGFRRLRDKSLSIAEGFDRVNKQMFNGGYRLGNNFKYFTTNGLDFDIPALQEVTGGLMPTGTGHIDFLRAMRVTHGDVFTDFYANKGKQRVRGLTQLDNIFEAVYGMNMQQAGLKAHFAADDTIGLGMVGNKALLEMINSAKAGRRRSGHDIMGRYAGGMSTSVEYQTGVLQNGMELFSRSSAFKGSDIDAVIDLSSPKGSVRQVGPAIYRNRRYRLVDQFMRDGKYSTLLYNMDDDIYHVVGRSSKEELQDLMQRSFVPYDAKMPGYSSMRAYSVYDAARREYEGMFVGDGSFYKAQKYIGAIDKLQAKAGRKSLSSMSQKEFRALLASDNLGLSPTQQRHLGQFYKRLSAEAPLMKSFMGQVNAAGLAGDNADIAMENFRNAVNTELGNPVKDLRLPSRMNQVELFVPGPKGGARRGIDATNFSTLEAGIRSLLTGGVKESSMNFSNVVDNFNQVVSDLVGQGVLGMDEGKKLIYDSGRFLAGRDNKTGGVMYLSSLLANNVGGKLQRVNAIRGVTDLSATSHMVNRLQDPSGLFAGAIDAAKDMITFSNKGLTLTPEAKEFIDSAHAEKIMGMQQSLGLPSSKMPRPISEEIEALAASLADQDVYMSVYIDKKNSRGLQLALYSKEHANDVMRKGLKSQHIAKAYIPLAENDMLISGGVNKANIMYAVMGNNGNTFMSTTQHQMLFKLKYSQDRIVDAMKMGNTDAASRVMSKAVYNAINPLSSMSRYADFEDELDFSSKAANWLRSSYVNISPLADKVLGRHNLSFDKLTLDQTNDLIRDIRHGRPGNYVTGYGQEIQGALRGLNLNLGVASVKTELLTKGIFAGADARWLVPFGAYSPATRENIRQAQNYYRLDPGKVNASMINPLIMTDTAADVYGGEITGLMVKTARMNDVAIRNLLGDRWGGLGISGQPSTYEQMGLMKKSVAEQFGTFKRKKMYLDAGAGLEVNPAIMRRLSEDGFLPVTGKVMLGQAIKDANGKQIGGAGGPLLYEPKYGSIINTITQDESGRYVFDIDEYVPSTRGTKFMTESGLKFTQRIIPDAAWNQAFTGFEDVGLIVNGELLGSKKNPPTMHILSQLQYAVDEYLTKNVTTGKMTRAAAEAHVVDVVGNMLGSGRGVRYEDYAMDGGSVQRVLMLPGMGNFNDLSWTALSDAVTKGLGVNTSRMIGGYESNVGYNLVRKIMLEEYPEFIGSKQSSVSKFQGISWSMRELEMIRTRNTRYGLTGGPDISPLYNRIKSNLLNLTAENIKENRGIFDILGQTMMGRLEGDYASLGLEGIDGLRSLPFKEGGNPLSDFAGTILDKEIAGGKSGIMVDLPERFRVGRGYINQIYMPNFRLENKEVGGVIQPSRLQRQQLGIIENIQGYRRGLVTGDSDLASNSYKRIQNLINEYVLEAGTQGMGSQGQIARNTLGGSLKHSGRTIASAYGVADYFDAAGNVLHDEIVRREGRVGISEKGMRTMLSGVGEKDIRSVIDLIGGDSSSVAKGRTNAMDALVGILSDPNGPGLPGLIGRNPTIGQGSVLPVKYFIDPMASRNSMITVGVATALNADNDGDYLSHALPYFGGRKAKELDEAAFRATQAMYDSDIGMLQAIGERTLRSVGDDMRGKKQLGISQIAQIARDNGESDAIMSHFGNPMTEVLETESRLLKSVGPYSNLSYAMRKAAETVVRGNAKMTVGRYELYEILGALGEQIEQKPISSKKLEELLDKSGATAEDKAARLRQYTEAQRRIRSTDIYNMDIDNFLGDATTLGILDDDGITGHYGTMLKEKLGRVVGVGDVKAALTDIQSVFTKRGLQDPALSLFSTAPSDIERLQEIYEANMNPNKVIPTPGAELLYEALGMDFDYNQAQTNLGRRVSSNTRLAGNVINEIPVSEAISSVEESIGKNKTGVIFESVGKALKNSLGGSGAALAAGALGAWALSSMMRSGPRADREPARGREDQAPSSDGTYVNPMTYAAGAPVGAGPTAYISSRGSGYERVNVRINGNVNRGMTNDEVAQLVSDEIRRQAGVDVNLKISSEDNRQTIDKQWLQTQFANALTTGYVY